MNWFDFYQVKSYILSNISYTIESIWSVATGHDWLGTPISAAVGAIVAATLTWLFVKRQARIKLTSDMLQEFNSGNMASNRYQAYDFLKSNPTNSYNNYALQANAKALWEVIGFYERLSLHMQADLLHKPILLLWFGGTFKWWWDYTFAHELQNSKYEARKNIYYLYIWLNRKAHHNRGGFSLFNKSFHKRSKEAEIYFNRTPSEGSIQRNEDRGEFIRNRSSEMP